MLYEVRSHQQFNQLINSSNHKAVIVLFTASWCPSCQFIYPDYERLSHQYNDILFLKVDVDNQISIRNQVGIKAMPTFMIYSRGRLANVINGPDKQKLSNILDSFAAIKNHHYQYQPPHQSQPNYHTHYNNKNLVQQPQQKYQYNKYPNQQLQYQHQHHHNHQHQNQHQQQQPKLQQSHPIYGNYNQNYNRPNQNYSDYNTNNNRNGTKQMNKYYY